MRAVELSKAMIFQVLASSKQINDIAVEFEIPKAVVSSIRTGRSRRGEYLDYVLKHGLPAAWNPVKPSGKMKELVDLMSNSDLVGTLRPGDDEIANGEIRDNE